MSLNSKSNRKYTSRSLQIIATAWVGFPVLYLVYLAIFLSLNTSNLFKVVLSPSYWFVSAIAMVAGFGILRIRWYGWYTYLLSNITIIYETMVALAYYSELETQLKFLVFAITTVTQMLLILIIAREIRVPYFFPKIRWWESDPRYKLSVHTVITKPDNSNVDCEIMDLSMGGCFIKTNKIFQLDELLNVDFNLFKVHMNCNGRVVWKTESTVTHPRGIGVKFEGLTKEKSSSLKKMTQNLKRLNREFNHQARQRTWQEYLEREGNAELLEQLEKDEKKKPSK